MVKWMRATALPPRVRSTDRHSGQTDWSDFPFFAGQYRIPGAPPVKRRGVFVCSGGYRQAVGQLRFRGLRTRNAPVLVPGTDFGRVALHQAKEI